MGWSSVIEEIVVTLRKWATAIAAYFAGRRAGMEKAEEKADAAEEKREEDQDEKDREFERLRRDDALRAELRRLREDGGADRA